MATSRLLRSLRTKGWTRVFALRRILAAGLVLFAAVLAFRPVRVAEVPVLVAARDLAPGTPLSTSDIKLLRAPPSLVPSGALSDPASVGGQVLAGAAAAGEPITSVRLLGPSNIRLTTGLPDAAAVAVRLVDDSIADLLVPGSHVDIVGPDQEVLASDAVVVTIRSGEPRRLLVVGLPRAVAIRVAAASLSREVTVTLR
ncbi:SAF domain-containing protein [Actinocrispum sp. NPDC049592]|uniref:SAF domain-containing protein n=1 Tax=Actinocrispum sp. NPDC049592 TaxID=3154835 RepID=UPI003416F800